MTVFQAFYETICRYAEGDLDGAVRAAQSIAGQGELYAQAACWLEQVDQSGQKGIYQDADAFENFIRSGGNVAMYAALERIIATAWDTYHPTTILDIGSGDGRLIAGVLRYTQLQPLPALDLVEPSESLLSKTLEQLSQHDPPVKTQGFNGTIQDLLGEAPSTAHWDLCQATWSLHNLEPDERSRLFHWLNDHCTTLLVAEFDVQAEAYPLLSQDRVRLIHDRYLAGITEYTGHMDPALEGRVKQGFLIPILFGYFRSDSTRSTYEQPIGSWSAEIQAGGFGPPKKELIYPYWWADAYLLTAHT